MGRGGRHHDGPLSKRKSPEQSILQADKQLQDILTNQLVQAGCIPFTVELFLHRQGYHSHQGNQQNPHHHCSLLTIYANVMQEFLQSPSYSSYYMHIGRKIKQTMQEFRKNC